MYLSPVGNVYAYFVILNSTTEYDCASKAFHLLKFSLANLQLIRVIFAIKIVGKIGS